jgi:hypothetical protein
MFKRIGQGLRAMFAFAIPVDTDAARAVLTTPALFALFQRMARSEQQHALHVMQFLRASGYDDPDLLTAALLHDAGKSRYGMTLFGRTIAALVLKASHRAYRYYLNTPLAPRGIHRPFVIAAQHPAWSAEDMAAAGAADRAVWLARHHADRMDAPPQSDRERLLAALKAADDAY